MSGRFKPGQSGNPKGRKPGTSPAAKFRKVIAEEALEILDTLIQAAKGGDVAAAKVLLDRICPPLKPTSSAVTISAGKNLVEHGENIIQAVLAGQIAPDIGAALIRALSEQSDLIKAEELAQRVERLEQCLKSASKK
jgi:hypothetical protein